MVHASLMQQGLLPTCPQSDDGKYTVCCSMMQFHQRGPRIHHRHQRAAVSVHASPAFRKNAYPSHGPMPSTNRKGQKIDTTIRQSSHVAQLVILLQSLQILLLDELVDGLLDILDLGREAGFDLRDGLLDEHDVLHLLARLHYTNDCGLNMD